MAFWVTFRIKKIGDYDARYKALETAIHEVKSGSKWWIEPTSFLLFDSKQSIDVIAARVKSALNLTTDMALIASTTVQDARVVGNLEDEDLFIFMPFTQRA